MAIRYAVLKAGTNVLSPGVAPRPAIPEPDPSWPPEMQEAHRALHADLPHTVPPGHGHASGKFYFEAVILNEQGLAQLCSNVPTPRQSSWAKLKAWLRR